MAEAPFEAAALLSAEPEVVEPFDPLLAGLLNVELLAALDVPFFAAVADSKDPAVLEASLLVLPLAAAAFRLAAPDAASLELKAEPAVNELLAPTALFSLCDCENDPLLEMFLLELWFAAKLSLEFMLLVELCVSAEVLE